MATPSDTLETLPTAPFADEGRGRYATNGQLEADVGIARRMLNDPRWPVSAKLRARVVEWLETIMEATDDDRARMNAIHGILAADKLNMESVKLELAAEKLSKPQEINVNVNGSVAHVFTRLDELESLYADAQPKG